MFQFEDSVQNKRTDGLFVLQEFGMSSLCEENRIRISMYRQVVHGNVLNFETIFTENLNWFYFSLIKDCAIIMKALKTIE